MKSIAVLGGGFVGITTALHLRRLGYTTELITQIRGDRPVRRSVHPKFASLFPAASIVPHTVEMENLNEVFAASQAAFAQLATLPGTGIRWQRHYELFDPEFYTEPSYLPLLRSCEDYGSSPSHIPFHVFVERDVKGWVAEILFAEPSEYLSYLYREFLALGGHIEERRVTPRTFSSITHDVVVNCTGLYAAELFGDDQIIPVRGHLVFVKNMPSPPPPHGRFFSYYYKPSPETYTHDLYFFPRSPSSLPGERGCLLGGSREFATTRTSEGWSFPASPFPVLEGVPRPVLDLNRKLLLRLTGGIDIDDFPRTTSVGYRPYRKGGVRLELRTEFGKPVIHNYGHGGGGVALSWGCALRVADLVKKC